MLGIDLVFIPEFRKRVEISCGGILRKAFQASEINGHGIEHLAGLWAAKEAVAKAAPVPPTNWTDIVITHDDVGRPSARLESMEFAISISHHGDYAVAVAMRKHE